MYLDLPVVIDNNLICSRDPRDVPALAQALVDHLAESGGLKAASRNARVLIVVPGVTEHQKWVLDRLSIFGISPSVWNEGPAQDGSIDADSFDMLVILDGPAIGQMKSSKLPALLVDSFSRRKKTILVTDAAREALASIDLATSRVIRADNIAYAMREIVASASPVQSSKKTAYPDSRQWAAGYAAAAAAPIKGATLDPAIVYDAALALWNGYDDYTAARMSEFLARDGRRVLIVGPQRGILAGLNGSRAEVAATYDDHIRLSASAVVIAPGGVWPKKTRAQQAVQPLWVEADEPARQRRLDWLTGQYKSGRMVAAFGFDSLYLGQQKLFKGKFFASTDQASVIWFGSDGAEYSPENAMFSDKNLLTAKPLVGVDDAVYLLQEFLKRKSTQSPAGSSTEVELAPAG
jgi:putative intracellular protease/amidase